MSEDNVAQEHFIDKRKHTEIKHSIFSRILKASLSIANRITYKNKIYTCIDLYAGRGTFDDGAEGSPILAFKAIKDHLSLEKNKNVFEEIRLVATEKNQHNAENLKNALIELNNKADLQQKVKIFVGENPWESYNDELKGLLQKSQWGFIFADPFSTELKLGNLKEFIKTNIHFKDILLLINVNAFERILGLPNSNLIIADYFDVDVDLINDLRVQQDIKNIEIIQYLIHKTFASLDKDFVINIALPGTRDNKLENSDRFYLTLITGAVGVADEFLKVYAELLGDKEKQNNCGQLSFFNYCNEFSCFSLSNKIETILVKRKQSSLFDLLTELYGLFYSWKKARENEIPTRKNIQNAINILASQNKIKFNSNDFLYKNDNKILMEAFKKKESLKRTIISIKS